MARGTNHVFKRCRYCGKKLSYRHVCKPTKSEHLEVVESSTHMIYLENVPYRVPRQILVAIEQLVKNYKKDNWLLRCKKM